MSEAPVEKPRGHHVTLRIKQKLTIIDQTSPPSGASASDIPSVELLIDDKPIDGFVQHISFGLDAKDMVPSLTLTIIPRSLDIDVSADMLVAETIRPVFCVTKATAPVAYGGELKPGVTESAVDVLEKYRKMMLNE